MKTIIRFVAGLLLITVIVGIAMSLGHAATMYWLYGKLMHMTENALGIDSVTARPIVFIMLMFAAIVPWSSLLLFTKASRRRGAIAGIAALGAVTSFTASRLGNVNFTRDGQPIRYVVVTATGCKFSSDPGNDPETGIIYQPVNPEIYRQCRTWQQRSVQLKPGVTDNFNTTNGEPERWVAVHTDGGCVFRPVPGHDPESGQPLVPVTSDLVAACKKHDQDAAQAQRAADVRQQHLAEIKAKRERIKRLAEIGQYFGGGHFWTMDSYRWKLTEIDIMSDKIAVLLEVLNTGTCIVAMLPKMEPRFTLITESGMVIGSKTIGRIDGSIVVNSGSLELPPCGERGLINIEFSRSSEQANGFAVAVNSFAAFHPDRYGWRYVPF